MKNYNKFYDKIYLRQRRRKKYIEKLNLVTEIFSKVESSDIEKEQSKLGN